MIKLSAVIITFNEERNIGRCLESLRGVVDDIVVVDSFSTDQTEAICLEHGARFVKHAFAGHIEQKNWAITQALFPHVLSLDADEALSDELKKSILAVKADFKKQGYYMNRLTNYCGQWIRHSDWYPDRKLRLWDSRKGAWGGTNPHDKYMLADGDKESGWLKGDLLHYSYYSVEEHRRQTEKFAKIGANALFQRGKRTHLLEALVRSGFKFIRTYFFKAGFLDGRAGLTICSITAQGTWLKYRMLSALQQHA